LFVVRNKDFMLK